MHRLLHILATACSFVLHPLLMPTYGMGVFLAAMHINNRPISLAFELITITGTIMLTLLIPGSIIIYLWKTKRIDSLHIDNSNQRTAPYIYTIMAYGFWTIFLYDVLQLPLAVVMVSIGGILALGIVTIVNHWWKISAHLTGLGGLIGGICGYALFTFHIPLILVLALLLLALVLMYARLYLNAHTPLQVVCGLLLGLLATFIPNLILAYA